MLDVEQHPEARPMIELRVFDPESLAVHLGQFPAKGSASVLTLFCATVVCGLVLTVLPVQTQATAEGTVHSVIRTHPVVAPISGSLQWSSGLPTLDDDRVERGIAAPSGPQGFVRRTVEVRRGQRLAQIVGATANVLVVQMDAESLGSVQNGTRVVVRPVVGGTQRVGTPGRVSAVANDDAGVAKGRATTVHIVLDGDALVASDAPGASLDHFEAGERVRVNYRSDGRSLWSVLSRGVGTAANDASAAARPIAISWGG